MAEAENPEAGGTSADIFCLKLFLTMKLLNINRKSHLVYVSNVDSPWLTH